MKTTPALLLVLCSAWMLPAAAAGVPVPAAGQERGNSRLPSGITPESGSGADSPTAETEESETKGAGGGKESPDGKESPGRAGGDAEAASPEAENQDVLSDSGNERAQDRYSRVTPEIAAAWSSVVDNARRSTARLLRDGKPIALATAVHEQGWLLTKSSEVHDSKGKELRNLSVQFPGGITVPVKVSDVHRRFDLALLKAEATGLTAVEWDSEAAPEPGSYLAAASPERLPAAVGVVSVTPRNLDESRKGFLGIALDSREGGLFIREVGEGTAAAEAGLLKDDVLISINGQSMKSVADFIRTISSHKPYETVKVLVRRGQEDKELSATLRRRDDGSGGLGEDVRNMMSGALSRNRGGYPRALQHDMVLQPEQCGGPVVNLDGHVVGLNIARSGRIECFAIPASELVDLLAKVDTGKFSRPELDELRKEVRNAESLLDRVQRDAERLKEQLKEAEDR